MNYSKSIRDYEKDLKEAKEKYEKLLRQMKKARSEYQYYNLSDEAEVLYEDIADIQMIVTDLRKQKKLTEISA